MKGPRRVALSQLESQLHHRSRRIVATDRVTFSAPPKTSLDKIPSLAPENQLNIEFQSYREWLQHEMSRLSSSDFRALGDKQVDTWQAALLRKIKSEQRRLDDLEAYCWDREKILARLPGFYFLPDIAEPLIILPRA